MTEISIVGPDEGEVALAGPTRMRILEDGRTTSHRLGLGEITIAPHTDGPRSTGTPSTTRASTSSRARRGSRSGTRPTTRPPGRW